MLSEGSEAGSQTGGPVGVRAVPTELRWKAPLASAMDARIGPGATGDA
jgi:hypothetical protein